MNDYSKITVFDFETCGLRHPIFAVSLGFIYYENFKKIKSEYILINPEHSIGEQAYNVHGISMAMVKNKPNFKEVWRTIKPYFSPDVILAGHNVSYDIGVLKDNLEYYGLEYHGEMKSLCTYENAKKLIPKNNIKNYKLDTLCDYFGITLDNHHNAFADVVACRDVLNKLLKISNGNLNIEKQKINIG